MHGLKGMRRKMMIIFKRQGSRKWAKNLNFQSVLRLLTIFDAAKIKLSATFQKWNCGRWWQTMFICEMSSWVIFWESNLSSHSSRLAYFSQLSPNSFMEYMGIIGHNTFVLFIYIVLTWHHVFSIGVIVPSLVPKKSSVKF